MIHQHNLPGQTELRRYKGWKERLLSVFPQTADFSLSSLHHRRQQLRKAGHALIDFFCEDHETFRLDDCFSIFNTFCRRFTAAVKVEQVFFFEITGVLPPYNLLSLFLQENKEREAKEAAQWRRIQELEEQKRHSWAGGEKVGTSTMDDSNLPLPRLTRQMWLTGGRHVRPALQQRSRHVFCRVATG